MQGKVVIITGGTSGIGKACAFEFGRAGAKIVISGRNQQNLDEAAAELRQAGIDVLAVKADVRDETATSSLIDQTVKAFGKIDVLINNAVKSNISVTVRFMMSANYRSIPIQLLQVALS